MSRWAPLGRLSLEYSKRDRCAELWVPSISPANWIRKSPTRKQCSVSLSPAIPPLFLLSLVGKINVNFYAWFMASHLFFWEEALPPVWPGFIWIQLLAKMPRRWFCRSNCRRSRSSAARDPLTPKAQYTRHPALHSRAVKHICQRAIKNWQRRRQQTAAKRRRRRQV